MNLRLHKHQSLLPMYNERPTGWSKVTRRSSIVGWDQKRGKSRAWISIRSEGGVCLFCSWVRGRGVANYATHLNNSNQHGVYYIISVTDGWRHARQVRGDRSVHIYLEIRRRDLCSEGRNINCHRIFCKINTAVIYCTCSSDASH